MEPDHSEMPRTLFLATACAIARSLALARGLRQTPSKRVLHRYQVRRLGRGATQGGAWPWEWAWAGGTGSNVRAMRGDSCEHANLLTERHEQWNAARNEGTTEKPLRVDKAAPFR